MKMEALETGNEKVCKSLEKAWDALDRELSASVLDSSELRKLSDTLQKLTNSMGKLQTMQIKQQNLMDRKIESKINSEKLQSIEEQLKLL